VAPAAAVDEVVLELAGALLVLRVVLDDNGEGVGSAVGVSVGSVIGSTVEVAVREVLGVTVADCACLVEDVVCKLRVFEGCTTTRVELCGAAVD